MKTSTYATILTILTIPMFGALAYFLQNTHNISLAIEDCAIRNNVHPSNCKLQVVNTTPRETDAQKLTLLMPPELN